VVRFDRHVEALKRGVSQGVLDLAMRNVVLSCNRMPVSLALTISVDLKDAKRRMDPDGVMSLQKVKTLLEKRNGM
jgi:hypothetical protein